MKNLILFLFSITIINNLKGQKIENQIKGKIADSSNYLKVEIVQYSDILGVSNDKPNGLLQFQGLIKVPLNQSKYCLGKGWSFQSFRSVIFDGLINRIDKSKEEIDYNYTAFLLQNNNAKKSTSPWLATTDIWRYSNLQTGIRLVPLAIEKNNYRVQFQVGAKLLKNLPYTQDSINSGPDSGKVKADFRSVYSRVYFAEMYIKMLKQESNVDLSLTTGFMWLKLLDSYYEQIDILQQDPFQRTIALSTISDQRKSAPIWYTSLRLGVLLGEEKIVATFLRVNYMLQQGTYYKPLSNIVDGRPVQYEKRNYYNNFFQVHLGTTIQLSQVFNKDKSKKKDDGMIGNSLN